MGFFKFIFNVVFQPLIDFNLEHKESHGYKLGETKIITKPFADDFEIITNHKTKHQKLQDEIQNKAETMGLIFKPSKCRSLSIVSGKPTSITFLLREGNIRVEMKTLEDDPHRFLGAVQTFQNSASDHFHSLKEKLEDKLKNLSNPPDALGST